MSLDPTSGCAHCGTTDAAHLENCPSRRRELSGAGPGLRVALEPLEEINDAYEIKHATQYGAGQDLYWYRCLTCDQEGATCYTREGAEDFANNHYRRHHPEMVV